MIESKGGDSGSAIGPFLGIVGGCMCSSLSHTASIEGGIHIFCSLFTRQTPHGGFPVTKQELLQLGVLSFANSSKLSTPTVTSHLYHPHTHWLVFQCQFISFLPLLSAIQASLHLFSILLPNTCLKPSDQSLPNVSFHWSVLSISSWTHNTSRINYS